ncbi:hypothetical protein ABPG75_000212 [Micractinium tetrahymenae]
MSAGFLDIEPALQLRIVDLARPDREDRRTLALTCRVLRDLIASRFDRELRMDLSNPRPPHLDALSVQALLRGLRHPRRSGLRSLIIFHATKKRRDVGFVNSLGGAGDATRLPGWISACTRLESLLLSCVNALPGLKQLGSLTRLDLAACGAAARDPDEWGRGYEDEEDERPPLRIPKSITALQQLQELALDDTYVEGSLDLLRSLPNLRRLQLSDSEGYCDDAEGIPYLGWVDSLPHLTNLKLAVREPWYPEVEAVLACTTQLEELVLTWDEASLPAGVPRMARLTHLRLRGGRVASLPEGAYLSSLRELDISGTQISISQIVHKICR